VNGAVTASKLAAGAALSNGLFSFTSSAITVIPDAPASVTPYKILGQIQTTANAATNVYVVPASTSTVVSTVTICNQSANNVLVDVTARFGSTALGNQHYLVYQYPLSAADTLVLEPFSCGCSKWCSYKCNNITTILCDSWCGCSSWRYSTT